MVDYEKFTKKMVEWIQQKVLAAGAKGAVIGLSGGIDSAVTAVLCKRAFPDHTLGLILPCHSNPQDAADARLVAEKFDIEYKEVKLDGTFDAFLQTAGGVEREAVGNLARANVKPRLRMTTLYYFATLNNYLVIGTDNRSELKVGYFTKYGDGGVDLIPIANLVKSQVRDFATYLGVPERIITKAPTAGLWEDQTDEDEMGVTYEELDHYILTGEAKPRVKEIVDRLSKRSLHKLQMPDKPDFGLE